MKNEFEVQDSKFETQKFNLLLFIVFLLFTIHYPLFNLQADEISSRSAIVMDSSTGEILYAKNPHLRCPPASTTKLMTAIVTIENTDLADIVTISRNAAFVSPHKAGLKRGDKTTVEHLLYAALIGSANDAAVALAEKVAASEKRFVSLMNRKAAELGATNTRFVNASGLPGAGQYTTVHDLSKIMGYAISNPKLREILGTRVTEISTENGDEIFIKNTNKLLWSDGDLVGGKTGYTRRARHCFVCAAEREFNTVVVAILGSPSREVLWKEAEKLITTGFRMIENKGHSVIHITNKNPISEDSKNDISKNSKISSGGKYVSKKESGYKKPRIAANKKQKTIKTKIVKSNGRKKNYNIAEKRGTDGNKG